MFIDNCQDVNSSQLGLEIQCNSNKNPSKLHKLSCVYQQKDAKVDMESPKTQNSQHAIEKPQSWRTDAIQLKDSL